MPTPLISSTIVPLVICLYAYAITCLLKVTPSLILDLGIEKNNQYYDPYYKVDDDYNTKVSDDNELYGEEENKGNPNFSSWRSSNKIAVIQELNSQISQNRA